MSCVCEAREPNGFNVGKVKSEVPSPFARALPERPVFEARGYRYCGT